MLKIEDSRIWTAGIFEIAEGSIMSVVGRQYKSLLPQLLPCFKWVFDFRAVYLLFVTIGSRHVQKET